LVTDFAEAVRRLEENRRRHCDECKNQLRVQKVQIGKLNVGHWKNSAKYRAEFLRVRIMQRSIAHARRGFHERDDPPLIAGATVMAGWIYLPDCLLRRWVDRRFDNSKRAAESRVADLFSAANLW